jgi:ribose 5-phosphate isomerase B
MLRGEVGDMLGIGSDHYGFALKEHLRRRLLAMGRCVCDFGAVSSEPMDYADVAVAVAEAVRCGALERAVLVCRTGLGMAIAANKVPGVRAAPVVDLATALAARCSNDAQIITLGADIVPSGPAWRLVLAWLGAEFRGGESARKLARLHALESLYLAGSGAVAAQPPPGCTPAGPPEGLG